MKYKIKFLNIKRIIFLIIIIIFSIVSIFFIYLTINQNAATQSSIQEFNKNCIDKENYGFCDNNSSTGLIVYPGAKVDYRSYSYLDEVKADIYIADFPFNISFLNPDIANEIISENNEQNWYLLGHSLGGVTAIEQDIKNDNEFDGIITLGSYPKEKLENTEQDYLAIFATRDGLVPDYKEKEKLFPQKSTKFVEINGGNHSGYGNYGKQKNDKTATITKAEQQHIIIDEINSFISSNN